jgi:hypothetical protein
LRIKCLHGFFIFQEFKVGQVSDFISRFGLSIVPWRDAYTFEDLLTAPSYSLKNKALLGVTATKNFQGEPWEVLEANGLVYDFNQGLVVPIESVTQTVSVNLAGNRMISSGLILPGSVTNDGERVREYSAWFSRDTLRFLYSEVGYV